MKPLWVVDIGMIGYQEALEWQEQFQQKRIKDQVPDILMIVEHPPTITVGRSGSQTHILESADSLKEQGISIYEISRGGDVTYHGPGQVVCYPILKLEDEEKDLHAYLHRLEEIMIQTLKSYDLVGGRKQAYSGAWVEDAKVGAVGVAVRQYVTMHGFALNVNPQLEHFDLIVPCGIQEFKVTSLVKLGRVVTFIEVKEELKRQCANVFNRELIEKEFSILKGK